MDRSSRWVSKSTRSLWIEKVKRNRAVQERETCKSSCEREPRHRQGWLRRAQVGPDFCPASATCHPSASVRSDLETLYLPTVSLSLLSPARCLAGSPLPGSGGVNQIGLNKAPCLQFSVRTHQHGCLSGCHVHDRTPRSPVQTPHTDCQPENAEYEHLLGLWQA